MPVSFFCKTTAQNVWKTVSCVSSAGAKRGRGAGRKQITDFNRGQKIGFGKKLLNLPGLNAPIIASRTTKSVSKIQEPVDNVEYVQKVREIRKESMGRKKIREHPLERGWNGRAAHGRRIGPPDDYNDAPFEGFNSIVLMLRPLMSMTSLGRTRRMHGLVVTGNGNGLAGFSTAIGKDARGVLRRARNRAGQSLVSIPRFEDHTVLHDFFSRYYHTTVFVQRKPKGHGIVAHRIVKAICEAFGIKDLYAKVEGQTSNQINLTKAFFLGLMNQKKYQDIANEKGLHLVELREENYDYPVVLASPQGVVRTESDIKTNENLDFTYYIYDGKIKQVKAKLDGLAPWKSEPTFYKYLDKLDLTKNREKTKLMLAARYGDARVRDVFPGFKSNVAILKKEIEEKESVENA